MKYISINSNSADEQQLKEDFKSAQKFVNVYLGDKFLFFKNGFKRYYIAYDTIKYAFRRVVETKMGRRVILIEHLVIAEKKTELAQVRLAGKNVALELMEALKQKAPEASFSCPDRLKHQ